MSETMTFKDKVLDRKGNTKHELYEVWRGMKQRCYSINHPNYKYYGARGITICDEWKDNFKQFIKDMGKRPNNFTLDRINNNGNYDPSNCRWLSKSEQQNNKRKNLNASSSYQSVFYCKRHNYWIVRDYKTKKAVAHLPTEQEAVCMKILLEDDYNFKKTNEPLSEVRDEK